MKCKENLQSDAVATLSATYPSGSVSKSPLKLVPERKSQTSLFTEGTHCFCWTEAQVSVEKETVESQQEPASVLNIPSSEQAFLSVSTIAYGYSTPILSAMLVTVLIVAVIRDLHMSSHIQRMRRREAAMKVTVGIKPEPTDYPTPLLPPLNMYRCEQDIDQDIDRISDDLSPRLNQAQQQHTFQDEDSGFDTAVTAVGATNFIGLHKQQPPFRKDEPDDGSHSNGSLQEGGQQYGLTSSDNRVMSVNRDRNIAVHSPREPPGSGHQLFKPPSRLPSLRTLRAVAHEFSVPDDAVRRLNPSSMLDEENIGMMRRQHKAARNNNVSTNGSQKYENCHRYPDEGLQFQCTSDQIRPQKASGSTRPQKTKERLTLFDLLHRYPHVDAGRLLEMNPFLVDVPMDEPLPRGARISIPLPRGSSISNDATRRSNVDTVDRSNRGKYITNHGICAADPLSRNDRTHFRGDRLPASAACKHSSMSPVPSPLHPSAHDRTAQL